MNLRKLIILFVVIAGFCISFPGFAKAQTFVTLEGDAITYSDLIAAPKTILLVWTTECPVCRDAMERLAAESTFLNDVALYFVDTGEHPATVKRFADSRKFHTNFRKKIILDKQYFVADAFSISAVPTYIFFKDKKPVYRSFYLDKELLRSVFEK